MSNKIKSNLVAGALLSVLASSANAAICDGAGLCGSGELFLNVWNSTAQQSYSLDLGVTADSLINGAVTSQSWNLASSSQAPLFGAFLSALSSGKTLQYNVAANNTFDGFNANPNWGVVSTFGNTPAEMLDGPSIVNRNGIGTFISPKVTDRAKNINFSEDASHGSSGVLANLDEVSDPNSDAYYDHLWGSDFGGQIGGGLVTDGDVGNALDLYLLGWAGASAPRASRFVQVGTFQLTSVGLLTYNTPSAIPLPAGLWCLGPALLGLISFARRGRA